MIEQKNNLITAKELAETLGVKLSWVYDQTRKGKLLHYKLGKYRRYIADEVVQSLRARNNQSDSSFKKQ